MYLNCGERYEDMIDHSSYAHNLSSCELVIRTHDLCDTGAVLRQPSYQAMWKQVSL